MVRHVSPVIKCSYAKCLEGNCPLYGLRGKLDDYLPEKGEPMIGSPQPSPIILGGTKVENWVIETIEPVKRAEKGKCLFKYNATVGGPDEDAISERIGEILKEWKINDNMIDVSLCAI